MRIRCQYYDKWMTDKWFDIVSTAMIVAEIFVNSALWKDQFLCTNIFLKRVSNKNKSC